MSQPSDGHVTPSHAPVFLLASGQRCGSTLVQRLLNSHPDVLIWGEQHGYLNGFLREYRALLEWETEYSGHRDTYVRHGYDVFAANMVPSDVEIRFAAAEHIKALFGTAAASLGKSRWGFKEVRYDAAVARFLQRCFPSSCVVHLTRDIVDCFISLKHWENAPGPWNRRWTESFVNEWVRINASFIDTTDTLPHVMSIRYEDMLEQPRVFGERLASFIDVNVQMLDLTVFDRRIFREGPPGLDDRPVIQRCDLDDEERRLLLSRRVVDVAEAYGYAVSFD